LGQTVANERILVRASRVAAGWAFFYALYRWYYAGGGTLGTFGTPVSEHQWRLVNAFGAAILTVIAILPVALLGSWRRPGARPALLTLWWVMAVGYVVHALVGITQRIASLTGTYAIPFPFWQTIDRRMSDLQALLFNETLVLDRRVTVDSDSLGWSPVYVVTAMVVDWHRACGNRDPHEHRPVECLWCDRKGDHRIT
jgi:hypothetical protein